MQIPPNRPRPGQRRQHSQQAQAHRGVGRRCNCALPRGAVQQAKDQAIGEVARQVAERLPHQLREALDEALRARHRGAFSTATLDVNNALSGMPCMQAGYFIACWRTDLLLLMMMRATRVS